jgi:hypothetical protein
MIPIGTRINKKLHTITPPRVLGFNQAAGSNWPFEVGTVVIVVVVIIVVVVE